MSQISVDTITIISNITVLLGGSFGLWKIFKKIDGFVNCVKTLQRFCMVNIYSIAQNKKEISKFSKLVFSELYDQYKALDGNSYIDQVAKEINKIPIK